MKCELSAYLYSRLIATPIKERQTKLQVSHAPRDLLLRKLTTSHARRDLVLRKLRKLPRRGSHNRSDLAHQAVTRVCALQTRASDTYVHVMRPMPSHTVYA